MTIIPLAPRHPSKHSPSHLLRRIADDPHEPVERRFYALLALGERLGVQPTPPKSLADVCMEVVRSDDVPLRLRIAAATALLDQPAGTPGTTQGDEHE